MSYFTDLIIIVILSGVTNALLGTFLVLRGTSFISFGLAHSVLLGIVIAFIFTNSLSSPWLLIGAALTGLVIVVLVEFLSDNRLVRHDVALGLIYLTIFALGIILLTQYAENTTLSANAVVSGQLIFSPYIRLTILGINLPSIVWILSSVLLINIIFVFMFYKELILTSFDPLFATLIGRSSRKINLLLMGLTSLTIVASYSAIGAILVIAFMITPPATATLFSKKLRIIILLTQVIAILGGLVGLYLAITLDISITGTIAVVYGMIFLISLLVSPYSTVREELFGKKKDLQPPKSFTLDHDHGGN